MLVSPGVDLSNEIRVNTISVNGVKLSLLHVSARPKCHHKEVLSVANVAPSKWSVA